MKPPLRLLAHLAILTVLLSADPVPEARSLAEVRKLCLQKDAAPVTVKGVVTVPSGILRLDNQRTGIYVQDASGAIYVTIREIREFRIGHILMITGQPVVVDDEPELQATSISDLGLGKVHEPLELSPDAALAPNHPGELITVIGEVEASGIGDLLDSVFLRTKSGHSLRAYYRRKLREPSFIQNRMPVGSRVRLTGVSLPSSEGDYQIRLRFAGDVVVLDTSSRWEGWLKVGGIAFAAVFLLVVAWTLTLRRSLAVKTREIRRLLERSEEASRLKSEFLANMSHEIRTPLHGILGMQELALGTNLTPEQSEYMTVAQQMAQSLLSLLNDLLDLSRIEAGKLTIEPSPVHLRRLVELCVDTFRYPSEEKGLTLDIYLSRSTPEWIEADELRLKQVLLNLVSNAVKFTEQGRVGVACGVDFENGQDVVLHFVVTDTGGGIPPEVRKLIFEPFRQADGSVTRRHGGSGLGLSISVRLVQLMGGNLWVDSELGSGSAFHFTMKARKAPAPVANDQPDTSLVNAACSALRILLVEDNQVNRLLVRRQLQKAGITDVTEVTDGAQAVETLLYRDFDAVLMDVQMPGMDGLEATRRIRSREHETGRRPIPIVGLTAAAMVQDRTRCLEAGMTDYLSKPTNQRALVQVLLRLTARARLEPSTFAAVDSARVS